MFINTSLKIIYILLISALIIVTSNLVNFDTFASDRSVTVSPFSFTYHANASDRAKASMHHALGNGTTTAHFGLNLILRDKYFVASAWVFNDSFLKPAGGLVFGPKYSFNDYFELGLVGGVYVRESNGVDKFPIHKMITSSVEVIPLLAPTISVSVPVSKTMAIQSNCAITYIVNNCGFGLKVGF